MSKWINSLQFVQDQVKSLFKKPLPSNHHKNCLLSIACSSWIISSRGNPDSKDPQAVLTSLSFWKSPDHPDHYIMVLEHLLPSKDMLVFWEHYRSLFKWGVDGASDWRGCQVPFVFYQDMEMENLLVNNNTLEILGVMSCWKDLVLAFEPVVWNLNSANTIWVAVITSNFNPMKENNEKDVCWLMF